mgnify:CR=1 FL=1
MYRFLFATALLPLLVCTDIQVSKAFHIASEGFGEAEQGMSNTKFDVWCSKRKNKCTVEFINDRIVVNGKGGVKKSQILRVWRDKELRSFSDRNPMNYYQDAFYITYKRSDGRESTGKFIILHENTASSFWNVLQAFTGSERREVGPNLQIEMLE